MLKEIIIAIQAYGKAHKFIKQHKLWRWIILPGLLYMFLFTVSMYFFWKTESAAISYFTKITGIHKWLEHVNSGWLSFLVSFAGIVIALLMLLFYFSIFKYVWLIIGSPLFAWLSQKTEAILENKDFPFSFSQLLKDMLRAVKLACRNLLWQTVYTIAILILGLIPVVGWTAPVFALIIECYYYGFSMLDYSCERHRLNASESVRYISSHKGLAIGNGFGFYLMHLIPIVGWVLAPAYAVVVATISLYAQQDLPVQIGNKPVPTNQ